MATYPLYSSPSLAHRHLQKLEDLGLLERNQYGDYVLREKTRVSGCAWVGRNLVPRLMLYSFFFMGAFSAEIAIITFGFFVFGLTPDINFIYLTVMTAIAMALFLFEGTSPNRKFKTKKPETLPDAIAFLVFSFHSFHGVLKRQ